MMHDHTSAMDGDYSCSFLWFLNSIQVTWSSYLTPWSSFLENC